MILKAVDEEKFKELVEIKFNNISEGFNKYVNGILKGRESDNKTKNEESIIRLLEKLIEINGIENSYVDFYYSRLSDEDKKRLTQLLVDEDKEQLKELEKKLSSKDIYFKLTKEMVPFFTRLSTREVLFSTFYFTKIPCTIWGNYNMEFPCFFKGIEEMKIYSEICCQLELELN